MLNVMNAPTTATAPNYRRLAAAVLARAIRDAQHPDPALAAPARRWLTSQGRAWAAWLDLDPVRLTRWLATLPTLPYEQLTFFDRH